MTALLKFHDVRCEGSDRTHSFTLHAGETRLLQFSSTVEKDIMIDMAIGETDVPEGQIEIVQGDRRRKRTVGIGQQGERRHLDEPLPVIWQPLSASMAGSVGWVAANGGLISNLKIWENVIETEQSVMRWLDVLGLEQHACAEFMAASPYSSELWQRKLAGLLRALVQMPKVLVVDAVVFEDVNEHFAQSWVTALEAYATQGHAVLVMADKATTLPWEKIE